MAALKEKFEKTAGAGRKAKSKIGSVHYHPFPQVMQKPFGLYVDGNPTFMDYDNVPLTVFQLEQRVISTAANSFKVPVWFSLCIDEDGTYLPFCSTVSGFPDNYEVPMILNGQLIRTSSDARRLNRVWPAIVRLPHGEDSFVEELVYIRYVKGAIISAANVYGFE